MTNLERIQDFSTLTFNWNNNGAKPFKQTLLNKCKWLEKYIVFDHNVFSTAVNTIQFEFNFNNKYLEIEVSEDIFDIFIEDNDGKRYYKYSVDIFGLTKTINLIKYFHLNKYNDIAVFTGAFNPPTKAHNHVMKRVLELEGIDLIVVALSNKKFLDNKQRKLKDVSFSEEHRLEMMLSMTFNNPKILIYGIEDGYTFNILSNLKSNVKNTNIYFIAGSDKLDEIPRWGYHDDLLSQFGFIILTRNEVLNTIDNKCKKIFKDYKILDTSTYENLSATKIREALKLHEDYSNMVSPNVYVYLETIKNNYYK